MGKKIDKRIRSKYRIRKKVNGTPNKPRLAVFKSNKNIYCQLIDDLNGVTVASASSAKGGDAGIAQAQSLGKDIAGKAQGLNIDEVVFDRGGFIYHGRIKAFADAAREAGLKF